MLRLLGTGPFEINLSIPLVLEYQDVCRRLIGGTALTAEDIDAAIDYICRVGNHHAVYYLWRPTLRDPRDDMVLELAVASTADIVTFNAADFVEADRFGVRILTPGQLLRELGERV